MQTIDVMLFRAINGLAGRPALDAFFFVLTNIGIVGWVVLALVLTVGAGRLPWLRGPGYIWWRAIGVVMGASMAVAGVLEAVIKVLVRRPRPPLTLPDVHVIGAVPNSFSFPSGHALTAFAAATVLLMAVQYRKDPRQRPLAPAWLGWTAMILAAAVGFSRVYVGVHYPSDVLAGAAMGWLVGRGAWRLFERAAAPFARPGAPEIR
ncbi:MAG TPA: phosphatase PAP2 family protein [Symbiobacteriaceae bacterium]|jgi:undecaprenyl-diphosphatase